MTTSLTHQTFINNGIEVIINTETGESFCSQRGYARLSGITQSAISKRLARLEGDSCYAIKTAEIVVGQRTEGDSYEAIKTTGTTRGTQKVSLIPEKLIVEWIIKDNPEVAKKFLQAGVRLFLHQLAGYNYNSVQEVTTSQYPGLNIQCYVNLLDKFPADKELTGLLRDKLVKELKLELNPGTEQGTKPQSKKESGNSGQLNSESTLKSLILCQLKERGTASIKELSNILGKTENTIRTILSRLKADGLVKRTNHKSDKRRSVWSHL